MYNITFIFICIFEKLAIIEPLQVRLNACNLWNIIFVWGSLTT